MSGPAKPSRPRAGARRRVGLVAALCGWAGGALLLGLPSACRSAGGGSVASASSPHRVLSLHDTATELVVLLGRTDRLVAITEPRFLSAEAAAAVAAVPRLPAGPLSPEAIAAFDPDLVLGTDVVAEQQPALPAALDTLGIPVRLLDPAGLAGLWETSVELGALLDASPAAARWVAEAQAGLPRPPPGPPVDVFLYDCCDPPFTAGGRAPVTEMLELLGARNVMEAVDADWMAVSWEAVAAADPALIIVHDYPWEGQGDVDAKVAALREQPLVGRTPAARAGAFVSLPLALSLEGPRVLELPAALGPTLDQLRAARP